MDPTIFNTFSDPNSFMGKLMGLVGMGQQQGQSGDGSVPPVPRPQQAQAQQPPGFFGRLANAALGQQQPPQPGFGANTAGVEGSPGASVPLPPPRPNPGQDLQTQQPPQQPLGLFNTNSDAKRRASGAQQIVNALGGIRGPGDLKPAQFAPPPPQPGAGPMQLPPMNLDGM
jgi:hypothetical protein